MDSCVLSTNPGESQTSGCVSYLHISKWGSVITPLALLGGTFSNNFVARLLTEREIPAATRSEAMELLYGGLTGNRISQLYLDPPTITAAVSTPTLVAPAKRGGNNATAKWLTGNWGWLRPMLESHLETRLRTSRQIGAIEDHIQTFVERLVKNDTLAPHLATGAKVQASVLKVWAYQSACTEIRGWGTDASLRTTRGAITARERSGVRTTVLHDTPAVRVVTGAKGASVEEDVNSDLYRPGEGGTDEALAYKQSLEACRKAIRNAVPPHAADRYLKLFDAMVSGETRSEIAESDNMSDARVTGMMAKMRTVLRGTVLSPR